MKSFILFFLFCFLFHSADAQNFLNGSFENNTAVFDTTFEASQLSDYIPYANGISGTFSLIHSDSLCGAAIDGSWFLQGFKNKVSQFTLELDTEVIAGNSYQISGWFRECLDLGGLPLIYFGSSQNDSTSGGIEGIISNIPDGVWSFQTISFIPIVNGKYISFTINTEPGYTQMDGLNLANVTGISQINSVKSESFPNPFTDHATIQFNLLKTSAISLLVYEMNGKLIKTILANEILSSGIHYANFEAGNFPPGSYYFVLSSDKRVETGKIVLVK